VFLFCYFVSLGSALVCSCNVKAEALGFAVRLCCVLFVSEIQTLALRVQALNQSVDWWNTAMIWALVAAAMAAIFVVATTYVALTRAKQLADTQAELIQAKDLQQFSYLDIFGL
jgi:hypothetical protein